MDIYSDKVLFVNLTEMRNYQGKEPVNPGGGKYVELNKYGHELLNFLDDGGNCYGYAPAWGKVNLKRVSSDIQEDTSGKFIDNVLIIFTGSRSGKGRLVVGFYKNAKVYAELLHDKRESRYLKDEKIQVSYNIKCKASDAVLIDYEKRYKQISKSDGKDKAGYGRSPLWYASKENDKPIRKEIIEYLNTYLDNEYEDDEEKYGPFMEGESEEHKTKRYKRNRKAKEECLRLKGYCCSVCGFNFEKEYGELGKKFIEVHHLVSITQLMTDENYKGTDPEKDLVPICSNCHSMIHRKRPPYLPEDIKKAKNRVT